MKAGNELYIDIHNHGLFGVDDGASDIEESKLMLQSAYKQGVSSIILTPHYRHGMFKYPVEVINRNFRQLCSVAEDIGIKLYLGCEYHVNSRITEYLSCGRCNTLAGSDYVLTEYSYDAEYEYIERYTRQLTDSGYIPVIAHAERYRCLLDNPKLCAELSKQGALIQINASSVLGYDGREAARFCKKILKNKIADIVASDTHDMAERINRLGECHEYIAKKYGVEYSEKLFYETPLKIIKNT